MDLKLSGKRVLVTGGSKGIGRAVADKFAEEGCDVVIVARGAAELDAACAEIGARYGVKAQGLSGDLTKPEDILRFAAEAGPIDILVNNAGHNPRGDFIELDDAVIIGAFELKLFGYFRMCRAFYPGLKERRGVIVNIIGSSGEWLDPDYVPGSTDNAACMAFTTAFGRRAARDRIRVVGVNPGKVLVDRIIGYMRARAQEEFGDPERWAEYNKELPLGRAAPADEIAAAVAFVASPLASSMTATTMTVDGGARGLSDPVAR